ncbi:Yae1 domain-containing protein [Cinnamomum micranthum f. kanehirae]|uniref:Yae1 domain-containing protein n=1 Tax=Cinnamomum micranthum f. kanehirae TaxID=337451 RepID=A0A443N869_9MAGN|nr:Yae1 domain-containing protein [Cinnamomum micranthum f. kanehirae]
MEDGTEKLKSPMESLEQLNVEMGPSSSAQNHMKDSSDDYDDDDLWCEDGSFYDGSSDGLTKASDLKREWDRRHNQFYTIGYRDGLTAGKEAAAQEGFNAGFKQSVLVGHSWGLIRGVTGALACLPDDLKEKLVSKVEARDKFQNLYESVHSISSKDALKLFHDDILRSGSEQPQNKGNVDVEIVEGDISECNQLGRFSRELDCLLHECPSVELHAAVDRQTVG